MWRLASHCIFFIPQAFLEPSSCARFVAPKSSTVESCVDFFTQVPFADQGIDDPLIPFLVTVMQTFFDAGMTPVLDAGSALGAHRHHGIIPLAHEKDIDVALLDWEDGDIGAVLATIVETTGAKLIGAGRGIAELEAMGQNDTWFLSGYELHPPNSEVKGAQGGFRVEIFLYSSSPSIWGKTPAKMPADKTCRYECCNGAPPLCFDRSTFVLPGTKRGLYAGVFESYVLPTVSDLGVRTDPSLAAPYYRQDCYDKPCSVYRPTHRFVENCPGVEVMVDRGKVSYALYRANATCFSTQPVEPIN